MVLLSMLTRYHLSVFSLLLLLLVSCDDLFDGGEGVDEELQPYIDAFVDEAASRDIAIDFDSIQISAQLMFIRQRGVAGLCRRNQDPTNAIEISSSYWSRATELEREFVVFHELGHCYLGREHTEREHEDGTCFSIMASGTGTCEENYTDQTREEYIDELFNQ